MHALIARLLYFVLLGTTCSGNLIVKEAGTYPIEVGDMALIFFVTVQNQCDGEIYASVKMKQCIEHVDSEQYIDTIHLIGGDMGAVQPHESRNLTLIYPNLYLTNRMGTCIIIINYHDPKNPEKCSQFLKDVFFNTTSITPDGCCESVDMDPQFYCKPVDCRIKYSGQMSFYNTHSKRCTEVPQCVANLDLPLPDVAYNPLSNQCKSLRNVVTKADLVLLENNNYKDCGQELAYGEFICHNGHICNSTGECICSDGWITSLDDNYEPSLGIYHMCNVEINGWINVNKSRIKITILLISIFAITIASKILIIMCILNMCFKWAKSSKKPSPDGSEFKKPCLCNEELIKKSSEKVNQSDSASKTEVDCACPTMYTRSPFVVKTPVSSCPKTTTSSSGSTATAEEIHIYVERAKTDTASTKMSNTDFSIEFLEEEEDASKERQTTCKGSSRACSTSSDSRKNAS